MKTLIINGSPRKNGDTMVLINEFLKNLNGEVKLINTYYDKISPCIDCRYCWSNSSCAINDEMQEIYKELNEVDNIIIASPLYFSQLTGSLLNFCSRFQYFYASRYFRKSKNVNNKKKNGVLILVGGGDTKSLDGVLRTTKAIFRQVNAEIIDSAYSLSTNNTPAKDDKIALKKAVEIALKLNELYEIETANEIQLISDSIAYCGLVCRLCHLSEDCNGCRSEVNCCGCKNTPEGCYQYDCCTEKGIDGCWECNIAPCDKGMFSGSHDLRLRAFIHYIKEKEKNRLAECIYNNMRKGIYYGHGKDYDNLDSIKAVIEKLEGLAVPKYSCAIILESLENIDFLKAIEQYKTGSRIEDMPDELEKLWHINSYDFDVDMIETLLPILEKEIKTAWYIHIFSVERNEIFVIMKNKSFQLCGTCDESWEEMIAYGESIGLERKWTKNIPMRV